MGSPVLAWPLGRVQQRVRLPGSILRNEGTVEDDLPQVIVGILEVAGIAAPEGLLRGLDEAGAGSNRLAHHRIHFLFAADIVANGKFRRAARSAGNSRIMGDVAAPEKREFDALLEFKEHRRAMLCLPKRADEYAQSDGRKPALMAGTRCFVAGLASVRV